MSEYKKYLNKRAVALKYNSKDIAPIIVASGMGHMAEKIVEVAVENDVPIYEDTSLATILTQLELGQSIPEELYKAVVDIYVYFLKFTLPPVELEEKEELSDMAENEEAVQNEGGNDNGENPALS